MSTYNEAESFYKAADPNDDFDDLDPDPNLEGVNEADPEVPPDQDPPEDIEPWKPTRLEQFEQCDPPLSSTSSSHYDIQHDTSKYRGVQYECSTRISSSPKQFYGTES